MKPRDAMVRWGTRSAATAVAEPPVQKSVIAQRAEELDAYYRDVKLRVAGGSGGAFQTSVRETPRPMLPIHTYQKGQTVTSESRKRPDRGLLFEGSPYDLVEISRARDTDSLMSTSIERHVEAALQGGYRFKGADEKMVKYTRKRIFEIEVVSQITMRKILQGLFDNLAAYGASFIVVRRDKKFSTGGSIRLFGKTMDPICTWAVADAPTMKMAENQGGHPIMWQQAVNETGTFVFGKVDRKLIHPYDVFLGGRHTQPGRVFGRSQYTPVLDDIMLLRELEQMAYIISQKFAFPLVQYVIGTKEYPAGDITRSDGSVISEVEYAKATVEEMPVEGVYVTPERHEIKIVGTEGEVLDLSKYITYFRNRVQEGCRLSNAVLGTNVGDQSKSTAQSQMKGLQDSAKYLQDIVADQMRPFIYQILMEGGFDVTEENMVELVFSSPDTEEDRANENHVLGQMQGNLLTGAEARRRLGKPPMTKEEENDTEAAKNHARDKELAKMKAAQKAASSTGKKKSSASKKSTTSKTRPTNQHKTKATKTRVKANDFVGNTLDALEVLRPRVLSEGIEVLFKAAEDIFSRHLPGIMHDGVVEAREESGNIMCFLGNENQNKIAFAALSRFRDSMTGLYESCESVGLAAFDQWILHLEEVLDRIWIFANRAGKVGALNSVGVKEIAISGGPDISSATMTTADCCDRLLYFLDEDITLKAKA